MSADEARIREFAYQIWESEGRPEGQDQRHWEMARKLAESEAAGQAGKQKPSTPSKRISKPKAVTLAEAEAAADEPVLLKKPRASKAKVDAQKPALLQKPRAPRTPKI